jgi:hypothetical protein
MWARYVTRTYGLTTDELHRLSARQRHACQICGELGRRLHIDHDHRSGRVRGLLCNDCNVAIGVMNERPDWMRRALNYLERAVKPGA